MTINGMNRSSERTKRNGKARRNGAGRNEEAPVGTVVAVPLSLVPSCLPPLFVDDPSRPSRPLRPYRHPVSFHLAPLLLVPPRPLTVTPRPLRIYKLHPDLARCRRVSFY